MDVFSSIEIRGVVRLGSLIFARNPAIYLAAAQAVLARLLRRAGLKGLKDTPAPWSPAASWSDADRLFVAQRSKGRSDVVFADYAWQMEAFPYLLDPDARTAVVMHDLFHGRAASFARQGATDAVAILSRREEAKLLSQAGTIIAIQAEEAEEVRRLVPGSRVLLAPMTAVPAARPQPGDGRTILFVGSNTAANRVGLEWFFEQVWPRLQTLHPEAELTVVGSVCRALTDVPAGVRCVGVVDRLEPYYATAAVVISPLTIGSGLKIKLVEALAQGKACVVTSTTLQGVEAQAGDAVRLADGAEDFAREVAELLGDAQMRASLGTRALQVVGTHFSAPAAHASLTAWLRREDQASGSATPYAPSSFRSDILAADTELAAPDRAAQGRLARA